MTEELVVDEVNVSLLLSAISIYRPLIMAVKSKVRSALCFVPGDRRWGHGEKAETSQQN